MYVSLEGIRRKQAIIDAIQAVNFAKMSLAHTREKIAAIDETIAAHNAHAETLRAMVAVREASDSTIIADLRARDGLMPFKEVLGILGCHRQTLYDWVKDGKIEGQLVGSRLKFDPRAVINYLKARRTGLP